MRRCVLGCVLATGLGLIVWSDTARAQVFFQNQPNNPYVQPAVSPYLNMTRGGNAAVNYYGLTKQQIDVNKQLQNLQQQQGLVSQLGMGAEDDGFVSNYAVTGHPTAFFNYSHYFGQAGGNILPAQPPPAAVLKKN